jgi:pimeloyl-ACP methyl ester carboxylesterase
MWGVGGRWVPAAWATLVLAMLAAVPASAAESVIKNGDFSSGLANWPATTVSEGSFSGYPKIFTETGVPCAPPAISGKAHVHIDVPGGADGYIEQLVKVPANPGALSFLVWGALDPVTVTISAVSEGSATPLLSFVPPSLEGPAAHECSGNAPEALSADLKPYAGKEVGLRVEATAGGFDGTIVGLTDFSLAAGEATVSGAVVDQRSLPAEGVKVKLSGTSDEKAEVSKTVTTNSQGSYSFKVPAGSYSVNASGEPVEQNGGSLAVRKSPTSSKAPECDGTAKDATCQLNHVSAGDASSVNFTYTQCGASERLVNGKQATGCPIIFIPGFLGSRMFCSTGEMWTNLPNPDFADLRLQGDGATNLGPPGSCAGTAASRKGEEGVVTTAAGADIYGAVLGYLNRIAPGRVYAHPYDWRKSPLLAKQGLVELVNEVLEQTGAKRVVLMGHSMGGLVLQSYIADPANAQKVVRAVTLGTPYWGAIKSHVALLTGKSNEVANESFGLDLFVKSVVAEAMEANPFANDLQVAARNMQGLYWLYPADEYGSWLQVVGGAYPPGFMKSSQMRAWISSLGGTPSLLGNAVAGHSALNGYPANGVDFQVVAGVGVPTEAALKIEENPASFTQPVTAWYASGDGTVPAVSATEGASEGRTVAVPIHYACGVRHVALPGNAGVQRRIEGFLLKGDAISGPEDNCPFTGVSMTIFEPVIPEHGAARLSAVRHAATVTVQTAAGRLTLEQAIAGGLVTALQAGGSRLLATSSLHPLSIDVAGAGVTVSVQRIVSGGKGLRSGSGPASLYGPVSGTLAVGPTGVVTRGGKRLRAVRDRRAPHTRARVTRRGGRYVVRLNASSPVGVAAIYVRLGHGAAAIYRKPLLLTASQLRRLRFESVDRFGLWERPHSTHA